MRVRVKHNGGYSLPEGSEPFGYKVFESIQDPEPGDENCIYIKDKALREQGVDLGDTPDKLGWWFHEDEFEVVTEEDEDYES